MTLEQVPAERIESGDEIMVDDLLRKVWSTGSGEYATAVRFDLGDRRQSFERQQPVWRVAGCPDKGQRAAMNIALAALDRVAHARRDFASSLEGTMPILENVEQYARNCLTEIERLLADAALGAVAASPDEPADDEVGEDFKMACEIDRAWNDGYAHGRGAAPATVETWARTLGLSPALVDRWLDGKNLLLGTSPRAAIAEGRVEEVFDVLAAFAAGRTPDA